MGKVGGGTPAKKKKGRPSLVDLKKRALEQQELQQSHRRSTRRNPNSAAASAAEDASDDEDEYYDDDDDERKEKKVKLVVRLPQLDQQGHLSSDLVRSSSLNSASCGSDSNADADNRKIDSGSGDILTHHQERKVAKAMDTQHGSPLETGPTTTPLPDKKLLVFILDRLQKKDTHMVFSDPVDPEELPDYHEIIEHPMDFRTVRSKLDKGQYSNLEELEADVYLICSNAMQYNTSDTVFFRQARSIQELAKRDFENLRQEGEDGELQPKVVKRGRPPSKHLKKPPGRPSLEPVAAPESTSGATLATPVDNTNESTPYNLRKAPPMVYKNQADGLFSSHRSRNGEQSELLSDWNEEFPAHIRRADMKYGNKHFNLDENRRDTYKQFHLSNYAQMSSLPSNFGGDRKQLVAVGLHAEHGYGRSLARFAANMGPIVWKVASKKLDKALPPGVTYAPGVVGEPEPSPPTSFFSSGNPNYTPKLLPTNNILNKPEAPSTSEPETIVPKTEDSAIKTNKLVPLHGKNGLTQGTTGTAQGTRTSRPFTVPVSVPPDLNVGLQGGSPQQPDLALQL